MKHKSYLLFAFLVAAWLGIIFLFSAQPGEKYYSRFGYLPACTFGIKPPFDVPKENFMAFKISASAPHIHGFIKYAEEFRI